MLGKARTSAPLRRVALVGLAVAAGGVGCEVPPDSSEVGPIRIGSYAATYDASTRQVEHRFLGDAPWDIIDPPSGALTATDNSTGLGFCPIKNTTTSACSALVEPANCRAASYNSATQTLSVSVSLQNLSNRANNGAPYTYTNTTRWPPNSTYLAPFYLVITGFVSSTNGAGLLSSLNTNIANCAAYPAAGSMNCGNTDRKKKMALGLVSCRDRPSRKRVLKLAAWAI